MSRQKGVSVVNRQDAKNAKKRNCFFGALGVLAVRSHASATFAQFPPFAESRIASSTTCVR